MLFRSEGCCRGVYAQCVLGYQPSFKNTTPSFLSTIVQAPPPPPHFFLHSLQLKNIVFSWNPLKLCKTTHSWRVLPHFPSNSPLKIEILSEPTLFENLVVKRFGSKKVGGGFNPLSRKGGSHWYTSASGLNLHAKRFLMVDYYLSVLCMVSWYMVVVFGWYKCNRRI